MLSGDGIIISVASGKGGTGKTTVAVLLAAAIEGSTYLDCGVEEPNGAIFIKPFITDSAPSLKTLPVIDSIRCTHCGKCARECRFNALIDIGSEIILLDKLCHSWLRTVKEKIEYRGMKNVEVKFPLIEDITMEVAKKYGMIQPGESSTKAVRAVFVIDPKGIIRTVIYYPLSLGRNFDELYRVIIALQTADAFAVATPADWQPGDDVIVPTAGSCGVAKERMEQSPDLNCQDWFFCTKKLEKDKIFETILK